MAIGNKDAEAQNRFYVPNNAYLQNDFTGSAPLNFSNTSSSGIISQAPIMYPPVNQGGGGGGGGNGTPPGPTDKNEDEDDNGYKGITGFDSLGNPVSNYSSTGSKLKNVLGFMMNPFGFAAKKAYSAYKDKKAKQELQDFYNAEKSAKAKTAQDMARSNQANNTGGYQAGYGGDFMGGGDRGRGNAPSDKGGSDSMGSSADGGIIGHGGNGGLPGKRVGDYNTTVRTGYFFGGRVNYKTGGRVSFKNGGLASIL